MDDLRQGLHKEANEIRPRWGLDDVLDRAKRRSGRRRLGAGIVGISGLAAVLGLLLVLGSRPGGVGATAEQSTFSPALPGTCDHGPWMEECPEADWARSTLAAAGFKVTQETPAAFVVQYPRGELLFWAMDPANHEGVEPLDEELKSGNEFRVVQQVNGVIVYELRGRWVWTVHGLNVWVAVESGDDPPADVLESLVRASLSTPY
jgi:hypothetical protein